LLSGFGLVGGGHVAVTDVQVRVKGYFNVSGGTVYVYLARNGVRIGSEKSIDQFSTDEFDTTLSGWSAISDADVRNLQVVIFARGLSDESCFIDYASVTVTYPDTDATPNTFSFTAQSNVTPGSVRESDSITVGGLAVNASVFVANGELSKNGGAWTTGDTVAATGDTFRVRHTAPATSGITTTTTLTIGGVSAGFVSTTETDDAVIDAATFGALTGLLLGALVESAEVTIAGINTTVPVSVTNGQYAINGGAWTATAGTVRNGDKVKVKTNASTFFSTTTNCTLTVGSETIVQTMTTRTGSTEPTPFAFANVLNVPTSTQQTSNLVTIAGLESGANVTVSGGEYSKNGGAYGSSATTCVNGDTFRVRHTSAGAGTQSVITTLTVGQFAESFCSTTTGADITPTAYSFTSSLVASLGQYVTASVSISGINVATPVNVIGGEVSINGGGYALSGSITTGQTLAVRARAPYQPGLTKTVTVIVGEATSTYSITARSLLQSGI
jgi:hypothetical protein